MEQKEKHFTLSWFFKWFLDNKATTVFLVTLLLGLNIFILSKISFLFFPVIDFLSVVMLPVILSGLLFYLLNPLVDLMEKYKINRVLAISIIFIIIAILLIIGLAVAIPNLQRQVVIFAQNVPSYLEDADRVINDLVTKRLPDDFRPQLEQVLANFSTQATAWASNISSKAVNWVSALISGTSQVIVALIIMPFMLFYLLRDGKGLRDYITQFLPNKLREPVGKVLSEVNQQLSNYVRGQITVAVIVAIMFIILFKIIGLRYAVTLGITAGFLNLVPYLGSFLAMIPALVLGLIAGPVMLLKVIIVFIVEQTIEGRFVSPLILGSQLNIHPITILFVLLTSGSMFGIWGVLLGIPIYASAKVVISAIFDWYKGVSGLYEPVEETDREQ
ncbi:AI-2E family transporter [Streptococcus sp. CF9-1]|uniref:AI-2E family transporter n=1 Tax=unclassified Streptococcus TaxID=2608887 RepID=UPI0020C85110|nr:MULTISPECIES: AI-2E family transporter [unclassified Streptococcus]MCP8993361.1 AI-2E family transporter [Streptococcus sp. CF9-3]MCP8996745.1 AI-2E family transporter [Streptococcus sp. CF9-1]